MGEAETPKSWFTLLLEWIRFHEKISPVYRNFKKASAALSGDIVIPNTSEPP